MMNTSEKKTKSQQHSSIIHNICISEFHDFVGKQIICQYPENVISPEDFHNLSSFFITKEDLYGKLIALDFKQDFYIIGIPMMLRNKDGKEIYFRQNYVFNISMMVEKKRYKRNIFNFQEMCRKIAYFFTCIEMDQNTLYKQQKDIIMKILTEIYESINDNQECFLNYDEDKFLFLKYIEDSNPKKDLETVEDHNVPVPLINLLSPQLTNFYLECDINLYKIINLIDGVNCVKKISLESEIENAKVKDYLKNLLFHGLIKLVDIFSFSNKYCLTAEIHDFISKDAMKQECLRYVLRNFAGFAGEDSGKAPKKDKKELVDANEIVKLYLQLKKEQKIGDFLRENTNILNKINCIKFLHFGLIHGFIRRAHEYLIHSEKSQINIFTNEFYEKYLKEKEFFDKRVLKSEEKLKAMNEELGRMVGENACLDKICVSLEISKEMIREFIQGKHTYIVCK